MAVYNGTRFYKGTTNLDICIVMMGGFLTYVASQGKALIDCGSKGIWLKRGANVQNTSNLAFGPNVSVPVVSHFGLIDGSRLLVLNNLGVTIPDNNYANLHSRFQVQGSVATQVTTVTVNTTLGVNHHIVLVDASGGNRTITLPNATSCAGRQYIVKKIDSSANTVTISAQAGQTIDEQSSVVLNTQYQFIKVVSNGQNWFKIG